jgi:hypothetical protein
MSRTGIFGRNRPLLFSIAYRMMGSEPLKTRGALLQPTSRRWLPVFASTGSLCKDAPQAVRRPVAARTCAWRALFERGYLLDTAGCGLDSPAHMHEALGGGPYDA